MANHQPFAGADYLPRGLSAPTSPQNCMLSSPDFFPLKRLGRRSLAEFQTTGAKPGSRTGVVGLITDSLITDYFPWSGGGLADDEFWGKHFPLGAAAAAKPLQH